MVLLSAWGSLRVILVLLIVWQVLRIFSRVQQQRQAERAGHPAPPDGRSKGEVRIERVDPASRSGQRTGPVEDADFEEIR
jgi:ABC-type transport system involved in cytochrome bd biosynthesis fused ATPase/permease subunit